MNSDVALSFGYYKKALDLIPKFPNRSELLKASTYVAMAYTGYVNGDYDEGLKYALEAIPILEKQQQMDEQISILDVNSTLLNAYMSLIAIYNIIGQPDKSKEYAEKIITVAKKCDSPFDQAGGYNQYGFAVIRDDPDKCLDYINKAYEIGITNGYIDIVTVSLDAYSLYEEIKGNKSLAVAYLKQSLEYLKGKQRPEIEVNVYNNLILLYNDDEKKQIELSIKALAIADSIKSKLYSSRFNQYLGELYSNAGNFKDAYKHLSKGDSINNELLNEQSQHQINYLTARFDATRRELEIERQQNIIKRQNLQRGLLAGGIVVSVVILALLWYMLRLRNRRNDALAEMNATKDKFFSIISHDLKNPAVAQCDALRAMIENAGLWDADTISDYYHELLKSAEGQVELLYNLLNWAQIQTGRMIYTPDRFTLSDLLSDITLIRNMAKNKGVALVLPQSQVALITGDRNMLSTVVRNLLTNAVKFTPAGGTVTLDISGAHTGAPLQYTISVSDTGVGMTKEQIASLFRLDSADSSIGTAGERGSGLGLIVCKELLEKHGSALHVESEVGKGSRFWFTISA